MFVPKSDLSRPGGQHPGRGKCAAPARHLFKYSYPPPDTIQYNAIQY